MTFSNDQIPKAAAADALAGRRVLIVEDNPLIALELEEMLRERGLAIAGTARSLDAALALAASERIDVALLDVNVGRQKIDPVANLLASRSCPFVFLTGYGRTGLPEAHSSCAIVGKPFDAEQIIGALRDELARGSRPLEVTLPNGAEPAMILPPLTDSMPPAAVRQAGAAH